MQYFDTPITILEMMTLEFNKYDQKFMNLALNLAKKNVGFTGENPSVGCVIVKNNVILATGITSKNGRPHAESNAINQTQNDLQSATIYLTLEPCFHVGKTNPCVDLIIEKKIARVVIATQDPDNRVNGNSIKKLQENGIEVAVGLFEKEAQEINRGFFKAKTQNAPFVTLKLATSLDGKIATKTFDSKWITNEKSRQYGHYLRAKNDAILIGVNSVKKDDPILDCRISGLEEFSPIRIIFSTKLDLDLNFKIFQNLEKIPTYIATQNKDLQKQERFLQAGVKIILFENLQNLLQELCKMGINNLLIEGGANVSKEFLQENLVDEIMHFQANQILGSDALSAIADLNINNLSQSLKFQRISSQNLDGDQLTILRKNP